jgi:hypothetical protein
MTILASLVLRTNDISRATPLNAHLDAPGTETRLGKINSFRTQMTFYGVPLRTLLSPKVQSENPTVLLVLKQHMFYYNQSAPADADRGIVCTLSGHNPVTQEYVSHGSVSDQRFLFSRKDTTLNTVQTQSGAEQKSIAYAPQRIRITGDTVDLTFRFTFPAATGAGTVLTPVGNAAGTGRVVFPHSIFYFQITTDDNVVVV